MRRLTAGYERMESRTPPASLFGAITDFFEQTEDQLPELQTNSATDLERGAAADAEVVARPEVSKIEIEAIDQAHEGADQISDASEKFTTIEVAARRVVDTTDVFAFPGPDGNPDVGGTSRLTRLPGRVVIRQHVTGLEPGAYTLWGAYFNAPELCSDGACGADDLGPGMERGDVYLEFVSGNVVGASGQGNFSGVVRESSDGPMWDAFETEIHLINRTHGELIPGLIQEQTGTFEGGCDINECGNVSAAVHLPVAHP